MRYCIDTTVVYYLLHGPRRQQEAVRACRGQGDLVVTGFVRGEYIRGFIAGLIDLYFTIRAEADVKNGIHLFCAAQRQPRRIQNAFISIGGFLTGHDDWEDVERTLYRLGEYILHCVRSFDREFPFRLQDPIRCEFGFLDFPAETFRENMLLDFRQELERIRSRPACDQCSFRARQRQRVQEMGADLCSEAQQQKYMAQKGYRAQAKYLQMAEATKKRAPTCWYCERLGDSVIALSVPLEHILLSGDTHSFPALAAILGIPVQTVGSEVALRDEERFRETPEGGRETGD
jgi:hypothetical protein